MSDYARALGARLRAIRTQQGLSLQGVEQRSNGQWKAVVIGSYERGDRAVTVTRLAELADFYRIPVTELLPDAGPVRDHDEDAGPTRMVLDLERLEQVPAERAGPLARYAQAIQAMRHDYNGRVLSIRREDLRSLALIYDTTATSLVDLFVGWGVLAPDARRVLQQP